MWLWSAGLTLVSTLLALFLHKSHPPPIYGVYQRPGKFFFFKYWIFRFILFLRKNQKSKRLDLYEELDKPQLLSDSPQAFDAVFFMGVSQDGYYILAGSERRKHNIVNGLFYIAIPGLGLLCSQKLPDTVLFDAEDNVFGAEGILIQPLKPMKKWRVSYTGEMWLHLNPSKQFMVKFEGIFKSNLPIFYFEKDLDPRLLAFSIANEPWTIKYFKTLKKSHQSHYEQMGQMDATITVNNKIYKIKNMAAFRDHSFGRERDWNLMHRYAFHMLFLEDGTKAVVGVICQPASCSVLQVGYVVRPSGEIHPLQWCDFKLWQHGESGKPPIDYAFRFKAGGQNYSVQVSVEYQSVHWVGWRWEARMVERLIKCRVNGCPGRGVSEWHYHSMRGRSAQASTQDPAWFTDVMEQCYAHKT